MAQALGVSDSQDTRLKRTIEEISLTLKRVGKAKMTLPLGNPALPLGIAELQRLGVAYTNCGPADVRRLFNSYQQQVQEIRAQLQ